jgi:hypothetical protein
MSVAPSLTQKTSKSSSSPSSVVAVMSSSALCNNYAVTSYVPSLNTFICMSSRSRCLRGSASSLRKRCYVAVKNQGFMTELTAYAFDVLIELVVRPHRIPWINSVMIRRCIPNLLNCSRRLFTSDGMTSHTLTFSECGGCATSDK